VFLDNWDMALLKVTHFNESKVLEVRIETFNTFNHAQFFVPDISQCQHQQSVIRTSCECNA
jgi:hypothetical protein